MIESDENRFAKYAEDLARMVRRRTISKEAEAHRADFEGFHADLRELFPLVHARLERIELGGPLLFRWAGRDARLRPILLMSHHDVVDAETGPAWKEPPFEGVVRDGIVWGRGTVDTKGPLCAILSAVEELLAEGFAPARDVYLASSHNEEILGDGAPAMVAYFQERGISLEMVMDEGGAIVDPPLAGVRKPFAMIATHEKGRAVLRFTAKAPVSHGLNAVIGRPLVDLARFIVAVDSRPPFARRISPTLRAMFESLAREMGGFQRVLFSNLWLFGPLLARLMPKINAQAAAMLGTTMVFTEVHGSDAPQVSPKTASVTGYLRYGFEEDIELELERLGRLASRFRLEMELVEREPYAPPSDHGSAAFAHVGRCVREVLPDVGVAPYILIAGTDARRFFPVCDNLIRFAPIRIDNQQLKSVHGADENLTVASLGNAVEIYKRVIRGYPE